MTSHGLKELIPRDKIYSKEIDISILKRIDEIFNKGLNYYLDPNPPIKTKEVSIFFRKEKFNSELNIGAKKIVNHFEEQKIYLSALSRLSDLKIERIIPVYKLQDDPRLIAKELVKLLYPGFVSEKRDFLKALITAFAKINVLVFEFVETWNKRDKANIDGLFLTPNVIVVKRQQNSFRREIFTLVHELGHYLLNEEEIENLDIEKQSDHNLSQVEKWCNDFSYHFLANDYAEKIDLLDVASSANDYHHDFIQRVSSETHLSVIAIYTKLLLDNKISYSDYRKIKTEREDSFRFKIEQDKLKRELDKENGIQSRGSVPKPILSPLFLSTIQRAYFEGIVNEYEACKRLNIKQEVFELYI